MMKSILIAFVCFATPLVAFSEPTRVAQYIYSQKISELPQDQSAVLGQAGTITDVIIPTFDKSSVFIEIKGGNFKPSTAYLKFKTPEVARIMFDILTKMDKSLILIFDSVRLDVLPTLYDDGRGWYEIGAKELYYWSNDQESARSIGEIIGPRRSAGTQSLWDQWLIQEFGRERLNEL